MGALNPRYRYLIYNVFAWCAMLTLAVVLLAVLRQYGSAFSVRHEARSRLREAEHLYENGLTNECERSILTAMTEAPELTSEVLEQFDLRLVGMPLVLQRVEQVLRTGGLDDKLARAQYYLLTGDSDRAVRLLEMYSRQRGGDYQCNLWLGRIYLVRGDLAKARSQFDAYWRKAPLSSSQILEYLPSADSPDHADRLLQTGRSLFWAGQWRQALRMFDSAVREGAAETAELLYYRGVAEEMRNEPERARNAYARAVSMEPSHYRSLQRLQALLADEKS